MVRQNEYFPQSVPHPGGTLAEKLEELQMGKKEFAVRTDKPEKTITAILKGESAITPDMAVLFEKVTKIPARFWLNHQKNYDEYKARVKHEEALEAAVEWTKSFPVADMTRLGWLTKKMTWREKASELLNFFGFAKHTAWEDYYFKQQLKIAFRISLANTTQPYAISAWLRKGELQAEEIAVPEYNEKTFKAQLKKIKTIMANQPEDFFDQLQAACAEAGVKVVHTPGLPKAPINGSTRWINDTPLIQLTGRYKRNDIFWFTFFHEAGHIIIHRKKDIFLEKVEYSDKDMEKEKEADAFAVKWTLPVDEEEAIIEAMPFEDERIPEFAHKFNTHAAIIVGRLRRKGILKHSQGSRFLKSIQL